MGKTYTMVGGCNLIGFIALPAGASVGAIGLVTVGLGAIKKARFRRYREEVILRDYQSGIPLPQRIQRQLKAKYFG
ncbi:hypothetical protein [Spirosoma aerolatum]|uniref:hypothetical protein n=1 Tax=Spirosoma aerolatum TaxID=1211326 RepID=UPI0012D3601A|nr:hypothetical protein [Spirosoma aerolatum]